MRNHFTHHGIGSALHSGLAGTLNHHKFDVTTLGFFIQAHMPQIMINVVLFIDHRRLCGLTCPRNQSCQSLDKSHLYQS